METAALPIELHPCGAQPLPYEYQLFAADALPDVNPLNPKYQLFIKLWKAMPLPLANALGPFIVRNLG